MNKTNKSKISLRDVLFLCHAKPKNKQQAQDWKDLINGTLDVAETKLSEGNDNKKSFVELLEAGKISKLAIVRNMQEAGVDKLLVESDLGFSENGFDCIQEIDKE